jgi:hypothetical protein
VDARRFARDGLAVFAVPPFQQRKTAVVRKVRLCARKRAANKSGDTGAKSGTCDAGVPQEVPAYRRSALKLRARVPSGIVKKRSGEDDVVLRAIRTTRYMIVALALSQVACDSERLKKLERENQDLRARLAISDLNLQEKCSRDAKSYFKEHWFADENRVGINYSIHYSRKLGKCFIEVSITETLAVGGEDVTDASVAVQDVYGGSNAVGRFEYESRISSDGKTLRPLKNGTGITLCFISGLPDCNSREQFDTAMGKYLGSD